jgi:hypothetical protein
MWEIIAEWGRPQKIIQRMRIACWIPKATNTHTGCAKLIAFPLQPWLHERVSVLRYTCNLYCTFFVVLWTERFSKSRSPCQISSAKYLKHGSESPTTQKDAWHKVETVNTRVKLPNVFGTQDSGQNHHQNLIAVSIRKCLMTWILEILTTYSKCRELLPNTKYAPDVLRSAAKKWPHKRSSLIYTICNSISIFASMIPILYHMRKRLFGWYEQPQSISFYRYFVRGQYHEQ